MKCLVLIDSLDLQDLTRLAAVGASGCGFIALEELSALTLENALHQLGQGTVPMPAQLTRSLLTMAQDRNRSDAVRGFPGFKVTDGWLTDRASIVVTVRRKVRTPPAGQMLPSELDGVPVDVRQASPGKRLEVEDGAAASAHARLAATITKPQLPYAGHGRRHA